MKTEIRLALLFLTALPAAVAAATITLADPVPNTYAPVTFAPLDGGIPYRWTAILGANDSGTATRHGLTYLTHVDNSTASFVEASWVLPAGDYSLVLGSNAAATNPNRQGYTSAPSPPPLCRSPLPACWPP